MKENKQSRKMKCKCRYEWFTASEKEFVTCPDCLNKTNNEIKLIKKRGEKQK